MIKNRKYIKIFGKTRIKILSGSVFNIEEILFSSLLWLKIPEGEKAELSRGVTCLLDLISNLNFSNEFNIFSAISTDVLLEYLITSLSHAFSCSVLIRKYAMKPNGLKKFRSLSINAIQPIRLSLLFIWESSCLIKISFS